MASFDEYLTIGNIFLVIIFLLILNQLIVLYQFRKMPPGPRLTSLPFIGNLLSFDSGDGFMKITASLRKKYGRVFSVKIGSFKVVISGDTASVKELLVRKSADYAGRPPLHSFMRSTFDGKDIAAGDYSPAWKFHRKIFIAAIRRYLSDKQVVEKTIAEQATKLMQYFEDQSLKDFDPANVLMESIANVSCRILFGKRFDSSHSDFKELLKLNDDFFSDYDINTQRFLLDFFPIAKFFPFRAYRLMYEMIDQVYEILRRQLKIQEKESSNSAEVDSLTGSFLQEKAAAENEVGAEERASFLSDEYMLSNMRDMFVAGYDTTSSTLRWAIAFLVHHPEIQKELQNQLDEVVGKDRMPNLDDLPNLPLVQAMIMETQRLGNVAENTLPHYTLKDTTLAGFRVPKDTIVFANLAQVHLDPSCWENPHSFNPHRHIDADGQLITNTGNFLPFSAGRRVCAGEALAKVELFLFLSWMLHKFTFLPSEDGTVPDLEGHTGLTHFPALYKIRAKKRSL